MARKFGRNFTLTVEATDGNTLTIGLPFTLEFDITRNILSSANVASIRVLNLNAIRRSQIRKNVLDYDDLRLVNLQAGYGGNIPVVFNGSITQAWSVREGTAFVTQIESFDGGFAFANASSDINFPADTDQQIVVSTLVQQMSAYGVKPGAIGKIEGKLSRGNSYSGSTPNLLKELTGGAFFIDNGKVNVLGTNEVLPGVLTSIDASVGLLGTPVREQTIINFDMLFEPRLLIGQKITLTSFTDSNFNGDYKIISLKHRGTISDAVCGDAITSVGLMPGTEALKIVGAA